MSRKRCIKLLMSIGKDRNSANYLTDSLSGIKRKMLCEAIEEFNAAYHSDISDDQSLCRLQAATQRVIWLWRAFISIGSDRIQNFSLLDTATGP